MLTPEEIVRCIRAFKTPVFPQGDEPDYFGRVKSLSTIKTLTITRATVFYSEGEYGEEPRNGKAAVCINPMVKLDAVASWGDTNSNVQIAAPIISSDAAKLLATQRKQFH